MGREECSAFILISALELFGIFQNITWSGQENCGNYMMNLILPLYGLVAFGPIIPMYSMLFS